MIDHSVGFGLPQIVAVYLIAVLGSIAIELAALVKETGAAQGKLPERYRTVTYPTFRVLFAFVAAGPLAVIRSARTDLNAFYIGLTAPLIFDRVAAGIKADSGDGDDKSE
jgi:hypothetical protein